MSLDLDFYQMFHVPDPPKKARLSADKQHGHRKGAKMKHHHHRRPHDPDNSFNKLVNYVQKPSDPVITCRQNLSPLVPIIELQPNPSSFAVFSVIRQCVMEKKLKQAAVIYNQNIQGCGQEEEDSEDDKTKLDQQTKVFLIIRNLIYLEIIFLVA